MALSPAKKDWFKEVVIYQIYPSSFCDSRGDGIGTLAGVTSKLDYLKELGVDVVWLSPIYKSPMKDMGYDISDYEDIRPEFGTLKDWEDLRDGLHARGMKLMMDLVVNHTSDQHEWFKESRSSKTNPKRDWYIWRPKKDVAAGERSEPNNWQSMFGDESAWAWDETTEEYYLRLFVKEQPDLNWENPDVRKAVYDLMKWWLDRGCDGFRMDVINLISKVPGLPDATPVRPGFLQPSAEHTANGPRVHEFLKEMNREVMSKYDTITVGETPCSTDPAVLVEYSKPENKELHMVFVFEQHDIDLTEGQPMKARKYELPEMKRIWAKYQTSFYDKGWSSLYLANHDQARPVSRFANDSEFRVQSGKLLSTFHNTLCGTVYIYQGDELALKNVPKDWTIEDLPDCATQMYYEAALKARQAETGQSNPDMSDVMTDILHKCRDNARTPIPWTSGHEGGFTTGKPWMKLNPDYKDGWNVEDEQKDPNSVLNYFKRVVKLRKAHPVLVHGTFTLLSPDDLQIFSYLRQWQNAKVLVVLNWSASKTQYSIPASVGSTDSAKLLIGTLDSGSPIKDGKLDLEPYEARVYML
ncbi:glycoside hydrolase family 13 protein [Meredithblackwellia eburnea MCA 4105]